MRLHAQRKFADAIQELEEGLSRPLRVYTRAEVLTAIGNCYNELGQFEESLAYHDRAIEEDPHDHRAYVNKGVVYRLMGDYDQAASLYSKALELAPDYPELHASMGALAIYQDDPQTAVDHLERAVELDDTLAVAHSNLAVAYATVGRFDDAEKELKAAIVRGYHQPEVVRERIERLRSSSGNDE
jgi:tetratricopeptide (TPR) repeat protein